jgi:hypothetical protein
MIRKGRIIQSAIVGASIGLFLAMLDIYLCAESYDSPMSYAVRILCRPALELAYLSSRVFFPYNHIGPGRTEVVVSDLLLCLISALIWAILSAIVAGVLASLRKVGGARLEDQARDSDTTQRPRL